MLIQCWDLGGQETLRQAWRTYFTMTNAVAFVFDATDRDRADVARRELHGLLAHVELKDAAVLVLANKSDVVITTYAMLKQGGRVAPSKILKRILTIVRNLF